MLSYSWSVTDATLVSGSTSQTVTVNALASDFTLDLTVTDINGCESSCSQLVTVNPIPVCTISGPTEVCPALSGISYSGPAGMSSYTWSITGTGGAIQGAADGESILVTSGAN